MFQETMVQTIKETEQLKDKENKKIPREILIENYFNIVFVYVVY